MQATHPPTSLRDAKRLTLAIGIAAAVAGCALPQGGQQNQKPTVAFGVDQCVPTVLAQQPGEVLQVVLKPEGGVPVWEIEVEATDGRLYDIECSGATGKIVETERRFRSADEPGFREKVKVSQAQAQKTALAKYPGKVERVEYEFEADGTAVYEFDIQLANGQDMRVEVDAGTGKLHEGHHELVEIGRLPY